MASFLDVNLQDLYSSDWQGCKYMWDNLPQLHPVYPFRHYIDEISQVELFVNFMIISMLNYQNLHFWNPCWILSLEIFFPANNDHWMAIRMLLSKPNQSLLYFHLHLQWHSSSNAFSTWTWTRLKRDARFVA